MGHGIIDSMWMTNELHVAAARQQPREHMMSRWQSVCAAQTVSGGQWGEGSGWRIEHSEVRGTCPLHDHVSIMHGSDTHHAYRPTEDVVSGERLLSLFTFRAPHRGTYAKEREMNPSPLV